MAGTKTTAARYPGATFDKDGGASWIGYGSGLLTVVDNGGWHSVDGMTSALQRFYTHQYGFTPADIPAGAQIVGINVRVVAEGDSASAPDRGLRANLLLGSGGGFASGVLVGNRAAWTLTQSPTYLDYTANTDGAANSGDRLWGFPWTPEAIFDPSFGVAFASDLGTPAVAANRALDLVSISIDYTDPATGYRWAPVLRCVPDNGAEETIDLRTVLTDLHGPMKTDANYSALQERRETINRRIVPAGFGFRAEIVLTLDILTMVDAAYWTKIVNRCMSPDWAVYLSMDGGVTERQVFLSRMDGPDPLAGKTHVGGRFLLGLTTVETFAEMPEFGGIGFGLGNW